MCKATSAKRPGYRRRAGFSLTDLCALFVIAVLSLVVAVPAVANRARGQSNRAKCASNLRQIALAAISYANQSVRDAGAFPRATFNVSTADQPQLYTGIHSRQMFASDGPPAGGPAANDVTAALYLLLRATDLTAEAFICPDADTSRFEGVIDQHSNFPGPKHLSYSLSNPYPAKSAVTDGWRFDTTLSEEYPFSADMNYGDNPKGGPTKVTFFTGRLDLWAANSANHWFEGQQVVYVDGHVEWQTTPFCGAPLKGKTFRDNIYANSAGADPGSGKGGKTHGAPQTSTDAVLLPTAFDGPVGVVPVVERIPGMYAPIRPNYGSIVDLALIVGVLVAVIAVIVVWARSKRGPSAKSKWG